MKKLYNIQSIVIEGNRLILKVDGQKHAVNLKDISSRLSHATSAQRRVFEISPSGYGIHWPLIDEDISVAALLSSLGQSALSELAHP